MRAKTSSLIAGEIQQKSAMWSSSQLGLTPEREAILDGLHGQYEAALAIESSEIYKALEMELDAANERVRELEQHLSAESADYADAVSGRDAAERAFKDAREDFGNLEQERDCLLYTLRQMVDAFSPAIYRIAAADLGLADKADRAHAAALRMLDVLDVK